MRSLPSVEALEDRFLLSVSPLFDLNRGTASAFQAGAPTDSARLDRFVYFTANDGDHVNALYRTDGTSRGTTLVKEVGGPDHALEDGPGTTIAHLTTLGSRILFTADDGVTGDELWVSDGTAKGTTLVRDLNTSSPSPFHFPPSTGNAGSSPGALTVLSKSLFFIADDGVHGRELWVTKGTPQSTVMVRDVNSQPAFFPGGGTWSSDPSEPTVLKGKVYFAADDGVHGRELWVSDGTAKGTVQVLDVQPGRRSGLGWTAGLKAMRGSLYFAVSDGRHGLELYRV
jgi:ELWxxDGT repeat protein